MHSLQDMDITQFVNSVTKIDESKVLTTLNGGHERFNAFATSQMMAAN